MRYGGYLMTFEDLILKESVSKAAKIFGFKKMYLLYEDEVNTEIPGKDHLVLVIDGWDKSRLLNGELREVEKYLEELLGVSLVLIKIISVNKAGIPYLDRTVYDTEVIYG
jgi:hypothetical protein